jgi:predicted Zn-ribbon and HTH transcriptional regulator
MSEMWETSRERLFDFLTDGEGEYHVKEIMRILEYKNIEALIDDFNFISRKIKQESKRILIKPPKCLKCGYNVKLNSGELRIPSKCPKCHEERFEMPIIKIENK